MAKLASSSSFALDFLRRLLCAHSAGGDSAGEGGIAPCGAGATRGPAPEPEARSPCIVARLMGLDVMPEEAPLDPPPPLWRSRSASSAEGWSPPCPGDDAPQPRTIRTSASLREKPAYLRQENDEFLLLSFSPEEHGGTEEGVSLLLASASDADAGVRRGEWWDRAKEQGRERRRKLRFGDEETESSSCRRRRAAAAEIDTLNSSPVSVLEARDGYEESSTTTTTTTTTSSSLEEVEQRAEPRSASSDEAQFILKQQSSRRKLRPEFHQFDDLSPAGSACHASRCSDRERRNRRVVNKAEVITPDVTGIWQPICRLVEEDLKNMEWLTRDGANVVTEMEAGILDELICETTGELLQLSSDAACARALRTSLEVPVSKKCSGKTINERHPCPRNVQARQAIGGC